MSTKIYNGYRIKNNNLNYLFDFSIKLRNDLREVCQDMYNKLLLNKALDELINFPEDLNDQSPLFKAWKYIDDNNNDYYNFNTHWNFIPLKDKDYTLVLFYTKQKAIKKIWDNLIEIEDWRYWDNSDKDENVTDEEWEQRKNDWSVLGYEPPCSHSFGFNLYGNYNTPYLHVDIFTDGFIKDNWDRNKFIDIHCLDLLYDKCLKFKNEKIISRSKFLKWKNENENIFDELKKEYSKKVKMEYTEKELRLNT